MKKQWPCIWYVRLVCTGMLLGSLALVNRTQAGINEWTSEGPGGGELEALAIDPTNPNILYAGAYGDIYKSTNGGGHWEPPEHACSS
jgi:photosystem II stability/assembly factor-like uncharacterized protein